MEKTTNPNKTQLFSIYQAKGFHLAQFKTGELSIFSYYIESETQAIVIDPTIDVHVYNQYAMSRKSKIIYVALTHYHADFISGHLQLKVPILMGTSSKRKNSTFEVQQLKEGYVLTLGEVKIKVIHTPGHTLQSSCFLLNNRDGHEECLFTGDTLFLNEVGRPDLAVGKELNSEDLAGMMYDSLQKLKILKPTIRIYPGHGAGSSCGKSISDGNWCTLEKQMQTNYGLKAKSKKQLVEQLLADLPKPPPYYFHSARQNQLGPHPYSEVLKIGKKPLTIQQFKKLSQNASIIDTRTNLDALKKGIIKGAYIMSEGGTLTQWIGNIIEPNHSIILFTQLGKSDQIIQRIARIGYTVQGHNNFTIDEWKQSGGQLTILNFANLQQVSTQNNYVILDVRNPAEIKNDGIIKGSVSIPFSALEKNLAKLPKDKILYTHCKTGVRARQAGAILSKHGISNGILAYKFEDIKAKLDKA